MFDSPGKESVPCVCGELGHNLVLGWPCCDGGNQMVKFEGEHEIQEYDWDESSDYC